MDERGVILILFGDLWKNKENVEDGGGKEFIYCIYVQLVFESFPLVENMVKQK